MSKQPLVNGRKIKLKMAVLEESGNVFLVEVNPVSLRKKLNWQVYL